MRDELGRFAKGTCIEHRTGKYIKCAICNKTFYVQKNAINKRRYCSNQCRHMGHKGKGFGFQKGHKINVGIKRSKEFCKQISIRQMGKNNPIWNNGKSHRGKGYILIRNIKHPFNNNGYVNQSHLITEKYIGRYLSSEERVHHINEVKTDDNPENLFVFENESEHQLFHSAVKHWSLPKTWLKSNIT